MTAPFRVGDPAVWIENDPEGMRVERTAVVDVRPNGDGWTVETLVGTELVDDRGELRRLVPLDAELAIEFEERGPSFVVQSTVSDIERDLDPSYGRRRFEHDLSVERGPEQDRGYGHDR
jgi:hypothetical protein